MERQPSDRKGMDFHIDNKQGALPKEVLQLIEGGNLSALKSHLRSRKGEARGHILKHALLHAAQRKVSVEITETLCREFEAGELVSASKVVDQKGKVGTVGGLSCVGRTALMLAIMNGFLNRTSLFLSYKISDVNAKCKAGHNALYYALKSESQNRN